MSLPLLISDRSDFEELVMRYTDKLTRIAYLKTQSREDAEDIVQDLFVNLWTKREHIRVKGSPYSYLCVALKNRILNFYSRSKLHQDTLDKLGTKFEMMQFSIIDTLIEKDLNTMFSEILHELPENMQKIFQLRNEDYTLREIAVALGLKEQTVKGYSAEMYRRIKIMLQERNPDFARSLSVFFCFVLTKL